MARSSITRSIAAALVTAAAIVGAVVFVSARSGEGTPPEGRDSQTLEAQEAETQAVEAYFMRESYAPGDSAALVVEGVRTGLTVQIFRAGSVPLRGRRRDSMQGAAVTAPLPYSSTVRIGEWRSGVYFAELRTPDGHIGYAPFVLSPRHLGEHRVAVVMPTNTWQAYNRRDADGDGEGDTWYEDTEVETIDMTRPFLDRGVPPHFGHYDLPFLRWLEVERKGVDFLSQRDLEEAAGGDELARAYDLIVFPGHHEYVTAREYDAIEGYRDLGGNLMFLSANNFFYRVVRHGESLTRSGKWRELGRPEASLIGVQYIGNDDGEHRGPFILRAEAATSWIFSGTELRPRSRFGSFGIEIDHLAPASPPGTRVVAEIPDLLGTGMTAQMTYYETPRGAKVFATGAFTLGGGALWPDASRVLENLWQRLATGAPRVPAGLNWPVLEDTTEVAGSDL
jgi:N,N-dimethylformamidase beta subunit-like, C-terminal